MINTFLKEQKKNLSQHNKLSQNIYESKFEGLTLQEYIETLAYVCEKKHPLPCSKSCEGLLKAAKLICQNGYLPLKAAFEVCSPNVTYTAQHARRRLLCMPLAAIGVGSLMKGTFCLYLVEKGKVDYSLFQNFVTKSLHGSEASGHTQLTKIDMEKLLYLAESDSEKERLKFVVLKASGLSSTAAEHLYGFRMHTERQRTVYNAMEHAQAIKNSIEKIAESKDKALLSSLGFNISESEESSTSSESESDVNGNDVYSMHDPQSVMSRKVDDLQNEAGQSSYIVQQSQEIPDSAKDKNTPSHEYEVGETTTDGHDETYKHQCETSGTYMNSHQLLDLLRKSDFNWFQFVDLLDDILKDTTEEVRDQLLLDFAGQLSFLDILPEDERLAEQSRQAYLSAKRDLERQHSADIGLIVSSDSESSETELFATQGADHIITEVVQKRRKAIQRKAIRQAKKKVQAERFLKRRRSKRVSKILTECNDIGKTIEDFVEDCGVGADSWRRTGVLTFDGNCKVKKKATFKRIQEHLQHIYKRKFSYGSVVQLCIARNKRRKSAIRYKGVAQVISRRARKGFSIRYNPDSHWSSSFYAGLNIIQLTDGKNIVNLGRDDQAGFRLDTMSTHKLHKTLSLKGNAPLTTHTDYVNKYQSTLQTSSYNFPSTTTTGELCAGVVKAVPMHQKNPAQHFADLQMVQEQDFIKPAFFNPDTGKPKSIECIRVDGCADEGPAHLEVQYWWTLRHVQQASEVTMVTSRNSGASFRNRVELQNGCQALGHANLFIPSTLNGSCIQQSGDVNQDMLFKNLDSAIDVYISRVDGAPCASTQIHLFKGPNSKEYQEESELVKVFLKGSVEEKEELKESHKYMYTKFEMIWNVRKRHLIEGFPAKYIYLLRCCYNHEECSHPLCKKAESYRPKENSWFPNGPPLSYTPIPTPDPDRPFGNTNCAECKGDCSGHYMKPDKLMAHFLQGGKVAKATPPSEVIQAVYQKHKGIPPPNVILDTARQVLLPIDEVELWFKHLKQTSENRAAGAKKAAETRKRHKEKKKNVATEHANKTTNKEKKSNKKRQRKAGNKQVERTKSACQENQEGKGASEMAEDTSTCQDCGMINPPDDLVIEEESISWVQCDSCYLWYHEVCLGLFNVNTETWLCFNCNEKW